MHTTNDLPPGLGKNLRRLRLASQMTQTELEKRAGIGRGLVSSIEIGVSYPAESTLVLIAHALNVTVHDLTDN